MPGDRVSPRFSILLPTRNRLEYLRQAVQTVLGQQSNDWELVISDNCSDEDVGGYARSLGDRRVRYLRTSRFIPVTDNWNNALANSSGDYVLMLGDDDGLLPGYFTTMDGLIRNFGPPDCVYTSAYLLTYPGATSEHPDGRLLPYGYATFLRGADSPFWLNRGRARELVRKTLNFQVRLGYNMQFALVSRRFIDSLAVKGPFFQSPFPDYYAMNAMLLTAERFLVCPQPLVTIGISPKSYGFYLLSDQEAEGVRFLSSQHRPLDTHRAAGPLLPGTNINTSWLLAMDVLTANYPSDVPVRVNYRRYRTLQIAYMWRKQCVEGLLAKGELQDFKARLYWWERLLFGTAVTLVPLMAKLLPVQLRPRALNRAAREVDKRLAQLPVWAPKPVAGKFKSVVDVFQEMSTCRS